MKHLLAIVLLLPISAFAQTSVQGFDSQLMGIGQCRGTFHAFITSISNDQNITQTERREQAKFGREQTALFNRIQKKAVQNYLTYLKETQPSSGLSASTIEARANTISRDIAQETLTKDAVYQRTAQCLAFSQRAFADTFIFYPLAKEGEPNSVEYINRAITDYGNWMSCNVVMDKDKKTNGDHHAKVISGLKFSTNYRGTMIFESILVDTFSVEESDITEFLNRHTKTVVNHAASRWDNANTEQQKALVNHCVRLNQT